MAIGPNPTVPFCRVLLGVAASECVCVSGSMCNSYIDAEGDRRKHLNKGGPTISLHKDFKMCAFP